MWLVKYQSYQKIADTQNNSQRIGLKIVCANNRSFCCRHRFLILELRRVGEKPWKSAPSYFM